ncbi:MAG: HNH endonuclease [Candidatus Cloacimonetes bacterium]|nr:HNH endonuclease [Candidatus Cloacimonadota bacterium]
MSKSQSELIMEYFQNHEKQELNHGPVVDWVTKEWLKNHSEPPRDIWRAIRKLHQEGTLIKIKKGVYKYDPDFIHDKSLFDFDAQTKKKILERDNFKCVVCGRGRKDGVELVVDHIKPKDKGGNNSIENGQTLCAEHNLLKKNYSRTEAGKRYFIKMYEDAIKYGDEKLINFCKCVFDCYDKHKMNGHIKRPNGN